MFQFNSKDEIITAAINFVCEDLASYDPAADQFTDPERVINFLQLNHQQTPHEAFSVCFFTSKLQLIKHEHLFFGSIDRPAVYPLSLIHI